MEALLEIMRSPFLFSFFAVTLFLGFSRLHAVVPPPATPSAPPALLPVDFTHLPWANGEKLTYQITWEGLPAAQGVFAATQKGGLWNFHLNLASEGVVNTIYPFTSYFWCVLAQTPWRSVEYGEFRFEPHRTIKERTRIDYAARVGTRAMWVEGKTKTFPVDQPGIDDVGTMLYHLRTGSWNPGDKRTIYVYESSSEKQAEAECQGRETRTFGTWPAQPLLRISVLPTKGTHKKGHLTIWMTDDARHLPLHADLDFKYGTFSMDLTAVGTAPLPK